jgi:DNA-binding transcriptional ArsR family regulator
MPAALATADDLALKAKLFRGFGDPSRLTILETLRKRPHFVTEIVAKTNLSQPNVSMHLACLEDCGLVTRQRRGQFVEYAIADPLIIEILARSERLLEKVGDKIFACTRQNGRRA